MNTPNVLLNIIILLPLTAAVVSGVFGRYLGKCWVSTITVAGLASALLAAIGLFNILVIQNHPAINLTWYTWATSGAFQFDVGFLLDRLTAVMMLVVTFVSLLVHIYSIGYMKGDDGYQRFFAYMSLFTFFMLVLVTANNFFLLFFGWEGVGLVSYLLISFWYSKDSAANGGFKAFIVNRVGDFGFLLGLAAILDNVGSLNYATVFAKSSQLAQMHMSIFPGSSFSVLTVICLLLFIGAMGKSAQMPLQVWLPESMEGPTPISALIHAATMVTAGIYMIARISPLMEYSQVALTTVMVIGATGALFMGLIAIVQTDIKRVIAYSTMSQLGYMMAANGASAYPAAIFHLATHAAFKALLFLAAGSVILALHHEQDLRKMGNLRRHLPITYITFLIGALALAAIPPFSGFYSKDAIIEAVHLSTTPGSHYAYYCLMLAAFTTALYIFRAFFMAFHGKSHVDAKQLSTIKESPWVVTVPLILLAIPSVILGWVWAKPMLYEPSGLLGNAIYIAKSHNVLAIMAANFEGLNRSALLAWHHPAFWLSLSGVLFAWLGYVVFPQLPRYVSKSLRWVNVALEYKLGFDLVYQWLFVKQLRRLSDFFYQKTDQGLIDQLLVNGTGLGISRLSKLLRRMQSGYIIHYTLAMIGGLCILMSWLLLFH